MVLSKQAQTIENRPVISIGIQCKFAPGQAFQWTISTVCQ